MYVIKRNGTEVDFDKSKIINAITKANNEVSNSSKLSNETIINIANTIEIKCIQLDKTCTVEEIQDMVEDELFKNKAYKLCKCYMSYRYKKALERKSNTTDEQILSLIHLNNEEIKQENSNKNPTINSTQRDYIAGEISKDISKRLMLPKDVVEAHNEGILHFHDMDYFIQPMHNCFSGYTEFVTDKGIRKFNSFNDGDSVYIKDKDGVIRLATVRNYGKQLMHKVTLKNCVKEKTIICTPNHRWILDDGSITTNLQVGQYLYPLQNSTSYDINSYLEAEAFCLGFVLGDGTDTNNNTTRVRLCGDKTKYSTIFKKAGYSIHTQKDTSDLFVYRTGSIKQNFLNGCGWRYMTPELKSLVFKGYYAADGTKDSNRLSTVDSRLELFIEEVSSLAGYYISSKKEIIRDTEYKQNARLVNYHFVTNQKINFKWKVVKIEKLYKYEDAWCVEEPITNTFTLACGIVTGNCCLVNLEDMLQNGTVISGTMIEKPHSFSTACNVATQIIAQVASSQYGGQTITLSHLAPFVDVSRQKIRKQLEDELNKLSFTRNNNIIDSLVEQRVKEEIKKGVQTIQYQVLTLMTTNGQTPFITVSMYLGEVENEQTKNDLALIIEEMLKQRMEGVKNEKGVYITPAFPKLVYVLEEDNINTDSKYWYLTELAAKCTAKRMVPDYVSEKIMKQLKINKFGTGDCYPPMGALAGHEHLYVRINGQPMDLSIKDLYEMIKNKDKVIGRPAQLHFPKERLNLPGVGKYNYQQINQQGEHKSGVYKITYIPEDVTYIGSSSDIRQRWIEHRVSIRCTGGIDGSLCFGDTNIDNYLFEVIAYCDNYEEQEREWILNEPNVNLKGIASRYHKVGYGNRGLTYEKPNFKFRTSIPQDLIDISHLDIKVYDIGGKWTKIRHIFKNDKTNTPLMMYIQYLENGKNYVLSCTEDHPLWTGDKFTRADELVVGDVLYRADGKELPITSVTWISKPVDSYDIGTESGTFIGSDIQMHNCRSFLTPYRTNDNLARAKNYYKTLPNDVEFELVD